MQRGAHLDTDGAEFAVAAEVAEAVELCLFDAAGAETRHALSTDDGELWAGRVDGVRAGQRYGFRVHGPWDPAAGARCNPAKLLLDPYARALDGAVRWNAAVFGHATGDPSRPDGADSAPFVPRSVVCAGESERGAPAPPRTAFADTVIYETHVKGFTRTLPGVPEALRGTYAGLGHPAAIERLTRLGVTAVELLPVHAHVDDQRLVEMGLVNYWGYQSIGFFAPHGAYAAAAAPEDQPAEFEAMVAALHAAGLEVILDVVYNHTAEGNEWGPTLCFRGLDNAAYYRLNGSGYVDDTGTGNTLNAQSPPALRLVMDSLRLWVQEMHVDGFRFDLAAALGRGESDFDHHSAFLEAIGQDPVLSEVKLIAEPWDTGAGGYEVGDFPRGWSEWNGRYRDTVRDFWRGADGKLADFATRITGSADLYGDDGRRPSASINFITAHDGFTLADLVSYNGKHNEANGEDNRDGTDDNRSWNCGAEGPTDDQAIQALRARQQRNLLATLLLSKGVPMLLGGDELGRTQHGNNNAYCQDNAIGWVDWAAADEELTAFVADVIALRRENPASRRLRFLRPDEVAWLRPDGAPMTPGDWSDPGARAICMSLVGEDPLLLVVNAWWEPLEFALPAGAWRALVDTAAGQTPRALDGTVTLDGRSLLIAGA